MNKREKPFEREKARRAERQEQRREMEKTAKEKELEQWIPKTETGKKVVKGEITSMQQLFESDMPILESKIVDYLLPDLEEKLIDFKKTTKVRSSGRQFSFRAAVLVGDKNEFVGIGIAKDKEKWPAVRKATKKAKMNLVRVRKGCGSWECTCGLNHSIPFKVKGKSASVRITLLPAPKGVGLVVGDNIKDVLKFVGINDIWSEARGNTGTKLNFLQAAIDALSQTTKMRMSNALAKKSEKSDKK